MSETDFEGNTTNFAYDGFKRPTTITFANGDTLGFSYDLKNRLLGQTDGKGVSRSFVFDANDNLTSTTDRIGNQTSYVYDNMDRLTKIIDSNSAFNQINYDTLGRVKNFIDRNNNSNTFSYNGLNKVTQLIDGNQKTWLRDYDTEGSLESITTPLGYVTSFVTDARKRITQVTSSLGNSLNLTYDSVGRLKELSDALGQKSVLSYNGRGQIISLNLPDNINISVSRNELGIINRITDPTNSQWLKTVEDGGLISQITDPLGRFKSATYDNRKRIKTIQHFDTNGLTQGTRTNSYDSNGNLIRKLYNDGTDLNFTFDAEDRLISANGLVLTRNNLGRITASNGIAISYDAGGLPQNINYAASKSITYAYDGNNNITSITDWQAGVTIFEYDDDNRLTSLTLPNGIISTYSYDNDGRLIAFSDGNLASTSLTRNAKGQVTAANRTVTTAATVLDNTESFAYDSASQLSSAGHDFDAQGRQSNDGQQAYTWDGASRLIAKGADSYSYDAIGYRLNFISTASNKNYIWNLAMPLPSVLIEKDAANDQYYYIYTPSGSLLYRIHASTNERHYYHFDEVGNTRFISNDAGVVIASYAHSPYGELLASTGNLDNPFTWQGKYGVFDDGNGLYYMRARYYDANTGRFISKDPIKSIHPKRVNPYQYAIGDPISYIDPRGTTPHPLGFYFDKNLLSKEIEKNRDYLRKIKSRFQQAEDLLFDLDDEGTGLISTFFFNRIEFFRLIDKSADHENYIDHLKNEINLTTVKIARYNRFLSGNFTLDDIDFISDEKPILLWDGDEEDFIPKKRTGFAQAISEAYGDADIQGYLLQPRSLGPSDSPFGMEQSRHIAESIAFLDGLIGEEKGEYKIELVEGFEQCIYPK